MAMASTVDGRTVMTDDKGRILYSVTINFRSGCHSTYGVYYRDEARRVADALAAYEGYDCTVAAWDGAW